MYAQSGALPEWFKAGSNSTLSLIADPRQSDN